LTPVTGIHKISVATPDEDLRRPAGLEL
jgi:hypothetical protein